MIDYISEKSKETVRRCKTRDPFRIAEELGITVMYCDNFTRLKGMYRVIKRNRYIFLNSSMSTRMKKIVCAHEIGHDRLHRKLASNAALQEFMLYDMSTRPEYEANLFASEILLSDEEILRLIADGYDSEQIAGAMDSDINLVALKVDSLIRRGYALNPQDYKRDFLKGSGN